MLGSLVDSYLQLHRAAGFKYVEHERHLRGYLFFATARGETLLRQDTILAWARETGRTRLVRARRLRTLTQFARFARAEDPRHEAPPPSVYGSSVYPRRLPYPFSPQDIAAMIRQARRQAPASLPGEGFPTLLGLLATTGCRISEALNLTFADVTPEGLLVRETKFRKSRLVPLHSTVRANLDTYLVERSQVAGACPFLFLNARGTRLRYSTVHLAFRKLTELLGFVGDGERPPPRLHDLRHYVASRSLALGPAGRQAASRHMAALATLLGHVNHRSTFWYLEASPELLQRVVEAQTELLERGAL